MKPGDLVVGRQEGRSGTPLTGILLYESPRTNWWGDQQHRWWFVLCHDGLIVEETENYMDVVK